MLNISDNHLPEGQRIEQQYSAFQAVMILYYARIMTRWLIGSLIFFVFVLFLPWTQNISVEGQITSLFPEQRPQTIVSTLDGRIERWYVAEGESIQKGDTILYISEIKDDYFDPRLIARTGQQVDAKQGSIGAYIQKSEALAQQIVALRDGLVLKREQAANKILQAKLKIRADSIDLVAADTAQAVAARQYRRTDSLFRMGIKSRTEMENKIAKFQETQAKFISQRQKLLLSRNELINARIEWNNIGNEYADKISKAESERQTALSSIQEATGDVAKLENTLANYEQRQRFRYITAPVDCFVNKALKPGIGETVKPGDAVVSIIPLEMDLAVELYIRPVDLPLIHKGDLVRLQFDGWPAIVFSGWPGASLGTFGGVVYAVETNISPNGYYRMLVAPDPNKEPWPDLVRPGSGVEGIALLNDVPVWYEIWRQLNGFPPDFYRGRAMGGAADTDAKPSSKK